MSTLQEKNAIYQQKFREKKLAANAEDFKKSNADYMKSYRTKRTAEELLIHPPEPKETREPLNIKEITKSKATSRKTKRYNKKHNIIEDIKPSSDNRKKALESSTKNEYITKLNIIHKYITSTPLNTKLKAELNKLIADNVYDENIILDNMTYLLDIKGTINLLRVKYPKENSLKSMFIPLVVVLGKIKSLNDNYQILTKVAKSLNIENQQIRANNILPKKDEIKIIDLDREIVLKNVEKIEKLEDKVIYSIYSLFPARREDDYRLMRITYNKNAENMDDDNNYLQILKNNDMNFVFNQYKTKDKYGQQKFKVPDEINRILKAYIEEQGFKELDYIFYSNNNKKELIAQSNFSTKISNVFKKVYGIKISVRYLRKSHATYLYDTAYKEKWSSDKITDYTNKMSHSISESSLYRVVGYK